MLEPNLPFQECPILEALHVPKAMKANCFELVVEDP